MGMAPAAHVLFNKFMTFNPKNPDWVNRDRFVLSYVYKSQSAFLFGCCTQSHVTRALCINSAASTRRDTCFSYRQQPCTAYPRHF
jgi:hypothetical protein